jgi:hypothetical protein
MKSLIAITLFLSCSWGTPASDYRPARAGVRQTVHALTHDAYDLGRHEVMPWY